MPKVKHEHKRGNTMLTNSGKTGEVTENICRGCCDVNPGESPDKSHFCRHVEKNVEPVFAKFKKGDRVRDKLCPHRKKPAALTLVPVNGNHVLQRTG